MDNDVSHAVQAELDDLSERITVLEVAAGIAVQTADVDTEEPVDPDYGTDEPSQPKRRGGRRTYGEATEETTEGEAV